MKKLISKSKKSKRGSRNKFILFILIFIILLLSPALTYQFLYFNKISPGLSVAGISLGGRTKDDAAKVLSEKISLPDAIKLVNQSQTFFLDTKAVKVSYDFDKSSDYAFTVTRSGNFLFDLYQKVYLLIKPQDLSLNFSIDPNEISKFVSVISGQDSVDPVYPTVKLINGKIVVTKGSAGKEVNQDELLTIIREHLSAANFGDIDIPIQNIDPTLSDNDIQTVKQRAETFIGARIDTTFEFNTFSFSDSDLISFIDPKGNFDDKKIDNSIQKIISQVSRSPQNPKFTFDNGRVTEFQPSLDGIKVDEEKFKTQLIDSINQINSDSKLISLSIPVSRTSPEVSTDSVNNIGIKELIGRGTSTYYHSIPSRVHNVALAASRINGTLVKPGETFSFNDSLGDVSQFTGYQQAYIISDGKTILGDGGGVCQVSTTLFRALLNAGLHITERTPHAYRVGYYEQNSPPGLDATVYGPSPDLKFVNNTPAYVLIEARADAKHYALTFELYGTSDGRVATISKPVVSDVSPALPTVYQDDPTLPAGTLKQTDFAASGAKVVFKYTVTRNGETMENRNFTSVYKPWAAVYLRGVGPAF